MNGEFLASTYFRFNFLAPTPPRGVSHIFSVSLKLLCRPPDPLFPPLLTALGYQPRSASPPARICLNHMGKPPSFLVSTIPPASLHFSGRFLYGSVWTRDHPLRVNLQPQGSKKSKPFIRGSWRL